MHNNDILKLYHQENIFTDLKRIKAMNGIINERYVSFSRHYNLFILFQKLLNFLKNEGIEYFVISGLLIGLMRHNNSFIPWDDDIDICVFEKDRQKLFDSIKKYDNLYLTISPIGVIKFTDNEYIDNNQIFNDIFMIEPKSTYKYDFSELKHLQLWPNQHIYFSEIYPLQDVDFHLYLPDGKIFQTIKVKVPNKSEQFMNRVYPNWKNEFLITRAHNSFYQLFPDKKINILENESNKNEKN
jgi:hypothetical protein